MQFTQAASTATTVKRYNNMRVYLGMYQQYPRQSFLNEAGRTGGVQSAQAKMAYR